MWGIQEVSPFAPRKMSAFAERKATFNETFAERKATFISACRLPPHVVVGKRVQRAGKFWLGQCLDRLLRQAKVLLGRDLKVDGRTGHEGHLFAEPFDQLSVVGGLEPATLGVSLQQQLAAEDLGRLCFPEPAAGHGLLDDHIAAGALERAGNGDGEDRGPGSLRRLEDLVDPSVGQARPGGIVDTDELGLRLDSGQGAGDGIGALGAPSTTSIPRIAMFDENLNSKYSRSSLAMIRIVWHTSLRLRNRSAEWSHTARPARGANGFL